MVQPAPQSYEPAPEQLTYQPLLNWRPMRPNPRMWNHEFLPNATVDRTRDRSIAQYLPGVLDQGSEGCHDAATQILTEDGWRSWRDYDGNAALATINQHDHCMEFQQPLAIQRYDYDGPLYYSKHRSLDFAITPNHRMYTRRWNESQRTLASDYEFRPIEELGWYAGLPVAPHGWQGTTLVTLGLGAEYDGDDFLALVALVISDGWIGGTDSNRNVVSFCCFDENRREQTAALAHRLGFGEVPGRRGVWKRHDAVLAHWFIQNAFTGDELRSPFKRVPRLVMQASRNQIEKFFDFFGDQNHDDGRQLYTSSKQMADDLQELLLRAGKRSSISEKTPRDADFPDGHHVDAEHCAPAFVITVREREALSIERKRQLETDYYHGEVFCATVPNSTLITRRNGQILISGNSCTANSTVSALYAAATLSGSIKSHVHYAWNLGDWVPVAGRYLAEAEIDFASGGPLVVPVFGYWHVLVQPTLP
jgi:hypothetical protein